MTFSTLASWAKTSDTSRSMARLAELCLMIRKCSVMQTRSAISSSRVSRTSGLIRLCMRTLRSLVRCSAAKWALMLITHLEATASYSLRTWQVLRKPSRRWMAKSYPMTKVLCQLFSSRAHKKDKVCHSSTTCMWRASLLNGQVKTWKRCLNPSVRFLVPQWWSTVKASLKVLDLSASRILLMHRKLFKNLKAEKILLFAKQWLKKFVNDKFLLSLKSSKRPHRDLISTSRMSLLELLTKSSTIFSSNLVLSEA